MIMSTDDPSNNLAQRKTERAQDTLQYTNKLDSISPSPAHGSGPVPLGLWPTWMFPAETEAQWTAYIADLKLTDNSLVEDTDALAHTKQDCQLKASELESVTRGRQRSWRRSPRPGPRFRRTRLALNHSTTVLSNPLPFKCLGRCSLRAWTSPSLRLRGRSGIL